jgi:hypothetical protein
MMLRPSIQCAVCQSAFEVDPELKADDRLDCPQCGEPLKVISQAPLKVDWAYDDLLEGPGYSVRSIFHRKILG